MPAVVTDSRSNVQSDPLRNFRFQVNINHTTPRGSRLVQLGFMTCDGLNLETQVVAYREGGMNTTTQKMPGQSDFTPITLSTGKAPNKPQLWEWIEEIFSVVQGQGQQAPGGNFRTDVDIFVLQSPYTASNRVPIPLKYKVFNAWPSSMGNTGLDATGNAVILDQIVLQHEGWRPSMARSFGVDAPAA
jgi:phage tail-like protein